jgi:N-acetylglucosamine-6-sulfatase
MHPETAAGEEKYLIVRILSMLALLAILYGCGQASAPSHHREKDTGTPERLGKQPTGASAKRGGAAQGGPSEQGSSATGAAPTVADRRDRPNIIFILTDDLDFRPGSISHMPNLQRYLVDQGTTFDNAFVSNALCCPSRATILRGQYSHNHNVLTNQPPLGSEQRFSDLGLENSTVATWLHSEGYRTVLFGKYLNHFVPPVPPGWGLWYSRGFVPPGVYETDFYSYEAANFIRSKEDERQPYFMWLGTPLPHTNIDPPPRYTDAFPNIKAPRPPSFNEEDVSDKPR